jgi:hypothetical protein
MKTIDIPPADEIKDNFSFSALLMTNLTIGGMVLPTFRRDLKKISYVCMGCLYLA